MPVGVIHVENSSRTAPSIIAVDTNVIHRAYIGKKPSAISLLGWLKRQGSVGILVPRVVNELYHLFLVGEYESQKSSYPQLARPDGRISWVDVFMFNPNLVKNAVRTFQHFLTILERDQIMVFPVNGFAPCSPDEIDTLVLNAARRHLLDATDAEILVEMNRAGIDAIASFDKDIRRAHTHIAIYTW